MAAVRSGGWLYVFDADAQGEAEPAMVLLPCLRLMEMERLVSAKQETVTFQISGQVTAYQGRNYLLVTYFTTLASEELRPAPAAPATEHAAPGAPASKDPSVRELIDRAKPDDRRTASKSGAPAPKGGAAPGAPGEPAAENGRMLREGLTVASRRGRIQRGVGGAWVFMPDNGAGKTDSADPAMILQPCLNLERIEKLIGDRGDRITLSVSGQVFAYQSRNYLLPTVYRVEPDREGNLGPGQ
jgi:hypothetical protein